MRARASWLLVAALVLGCTSNGAGDTSNGARGTSNGADDANDATGAGAGVVDQSVPVVEAVGAHEIGAVRIEVPEGAFETPLGVRVAAGEVPDDGPGVVLEDSTVVISPEDGGGVRSDEPVRFTVGFDPSEVEQAGELVGVYHHPVGGWSLLRLDEVDLAAGQASFETYHLSWFGAARLSQDERIAAHIERTAANEMARAEAVGASEAQIEAAVAQILEDGAGVGDRGALEVITRAVVSKAVPQGELAIAIYDGDADAFVEQVANLTGEALLEAAGDDAGVIEAVTGDVGDAVAEAAAAGGRLSETDLAGLSQQLGRRLIESVPVVSTLHSYGEAAAEVIDELINEVWLDPEIDKAFQVYRDGAEGGWFGYSVDAGDWDALSSQMRGVMRQYRINAVEAHCRVRECVASQLTADEREAIGDAAEAALKDRFDARIAREPELAAIEQARSELYDRLDRRGLLTTGPSNPIWREGQELEDLLDRLEGQLDRVRSVAGRQTLITEEQDTSQLDLDPDALPAQAAAHAIGAWYDADPDDREQALRDVLVDWDLIEPEPDIDLTGSYQGTMSVTGVYAIATDGSGAEEQCDDLDPDPRDADPERLSLTLQPDDDGGGSAEVVVDGSGLQTAGERLNETTSLTWSTEEVRFTLTDLPDGGTLAFTGSPQVREDGSVHLTGTWEARFTFSEVSVLGEVQELDEDLAYAVRGTWQATS